MIFLEKLFAFKHRVYGFEQSLAVSYYYSFFKLSTGLATAAFMDCQLTVRKAIPKITIPTKRNGMRARSILNVKLFSHFCMRPCQLVAG